MVTERDPRFAILDELDFLNHAAVAPISGPAGAALRTYAEQAARRAYVGGGWYAAMGRVKQLAARLINADGPRDIALIPNTSFGLNLVARGVDWRPGDRVVTTGEEYPANRYPWRDLTAWGWWCMRCRPMTRGVFAPGAWPTRWTQTRGWCR